MFPISVIQSSARLAARPMGMITPRNPISLLSGNDPLRHDDCWALVERVAASQVFLKSPKLREFLLYVCATTLQNHLEDVREQQVGVHVFTGAGLQHERGQHRAGPGSRASQTASPLLRNGWQRRAGRLLHPKRQIHPVFAPAAPAIPRSAGGRGLRDSGSRRACRSCADPAPSRRPGLALQIVGGLLLAVLGWLAGMLFPTLQRSVPLGALLRNDNAFYEAMLGSIGRDGKTR